jgi:hypothetical protein
LPKIRISRAWPFIAVAYSAAVAMVIRTLSLAIDAIPA